VIGYWLVATVGASRLLSCQLFKTSGYLNFVLDYCPTGDPF